MIDSMISRVRLRDLTRLGRSRAGSATASGRSAGASASRGEPVTVTFLTSSSGDSARRVIGLKPVPVAEFERTLPVIRDLMNGRRVTWNETEVELAWAKERPQIPLYVAGYGPRVLAAAGRHADGVIIQLAEPE